MKKILVIPALIVILFACKTQKGGDKSNAIEVTEVVKVIEPKFSLVDISGDFVVSKMTDWEFESDAPTLRIESNGIVSGHNGCNTYFGRINPNANNSIDKLGSTRMACSGKQGELEKTFMNWMRNVDSISRFGNEIQFFSEETIVIVAKKLNLTGEFIVSSVGRIYSENRGMKFSISEGRLSGSTGCNSFFGSVVQKGRDLSFTEIGATERACKDNDSSLESQFLKGMSEVSYFTQKGDKIEFYKGIDLLFTAKKISEK